jgi:hypothetical protein
MVVSEYSWDLVLINRGPDQRLEKDFFIFVYVH